MDTANGPFVMSQRGVGGSEITQITSSDVEGPVKPVLKRTQARRLYAHG